MNKEHLDREILEIERHAWRVWLERGDARECARCGQPYIPSRSSDADLCASCVPLRSLKVGDKSPQYAKCVVCNGPVRGRRGDSLYCGDSCKKAAYRKRKNANHGTAQDDDETEDVGGDIGSEAKGRQPAREEAST